MACQHIIMALVVCIVWNQIRDNSLHDPLNFEIGGLDCHVLQQSTHHVSV